MLRGGIEAIRQVARPGTPPEPDLVFYATWISVWGRWALWLAGLFLLSYRPAFWYPHAAEYAVIPVALMIVNGAAHYRLLRNMAVTPRLLLLLSAVDITLITFGVAVGSGYTSHLFVAYYPALAVVAVVFSSLWFSLAWTTTVVTIYIVVCLVAGPGLDFAAGADTPIISRMTVLYVLVLGISLVTRFERVRWQAAVARERQLREERIELSQKIHDTTAQTAYMIDLGLHRARQLAGDTNHDLVAALDATSALSRSAMWEMRGPIDAGHIIEGRELGRVLWSHCATFERITAVPAKMWQSGDEPPLATETRSGLFSIAHNALTNAFLHAQPGGVELGLSFEPGLITLSVSDNGLGLPDDYAERGRGFSGMRAEAEQIGGTLIVESPDGGIGTTITCVVSLDRAEGGI